MDPSLMTREEIDRRGRVVIEPCYVCHHNRQIHVLEMIASYSVHGQMNVRSIEDACVACTCLEFIVPPPPPEDPEHAEHVTRLEQLCTYHRGQVCGKPQTDRETHGPTDEPLRGRHVFRHDPKDAHWLTDAAGEWRT